MQARLEAALLGAADDAANEKAADDAASTAGAGAIGATPPAPASISLRSQLEGAEAPEGAEPEGAVDGGGSCGQGPRLRGYSIPQPPLAPAGRDEALTEEEHARLRVKLAAASRVVQGDAMVKFCGSRGRRKRHVSACWARWPEITRDTPRVGASAMSACWARAAV